MSEKHNKNCTCHDCKSGENAGPSLTEQGEMYYQKTGIKIGDSLAGDEKFLYAEEERVHFKQLNSPNGW